MFDAVAFISSSFMAFTGTVNFISCTLSQDLSEVLGTLVSLDSQSRFVE